MASIQTSAGSTVMPPTGRAGPWISLELVRPTVDRQVLALLRSRTFSDREFVERSSGQVWLAPPLAKMLTDLLLSRLEVAADARAREIAISLARSAPSPVRLRSHRARQGGGKVESRPARGVKAERLASACRSCGLVLDSPDRQVCDECLPLVDAERTAKLSTSGKATLAAMRASLDDPARAPDAVVRQRAKARAESRAARVWEQEHGRGDPDVYLSEVLPLIREMTVPQLIKLTGLSQFHCWKVRKGDRRLHARHWDAVKSYLPP
jgi:hypothetical protein